MCSRTELPEPGQGIGYFDVMLGLILAVVVCVSVAEIVGG